jgi:pyruvate dehydrogenase E1 component alpha subunit
MAETSPDGTAGAPRRNSPRELVDRYRIMARIRAFEEAAEQAYAAGLVRGSLHLYIGEEAIGAGVCGNLRQTDLITSNHRGHGHTLAKGANPAAMYKELFGRIGGTSDGKGGSMHIADFSVGMLGANGIVCAGIPIAVGAAQGKKMMGEDCVVACFFGDGAINRGPFLEGLNWAKIYDLPVLFVCEDNQYAATTRSSDLTGGDGPAARADSLGVTGYTVDGNDLVAVDALVTQVVADIRAGKGPALLHCKTYRQKGHTLSDKQVYRSQDEVASYVAQDPITRCRAYLVEHGIDGAELAAIDQAAQAEMAAAVEEAKAAPAPTAADAYTEVQDVGAPQWQS